MLDTWAGAFPVIGCRIKVRASVEIPAGVLRTLDFPEYIRARVHFEDDGPTYHVVAKVIYFDAAANGKLYRRGKIHLPERVMQDEVLGLSGCALVDFALPEPAEVADLRRLGDGHVQRPLLAPVDGAVRFRARIDADDGDKPDASVGIPSAVLRGILLAGWPAAVGAEVNSRGFQTRLRFYGASVRERACITVPAAVYRELGIAPNDLVWVHLRPLTVFTAGHPVVGPPPGQIDWVHFVSDAVTVVDDGGGRVLLLRPSEARPTILRHAPLPRAAGLLGLYLAEGLKRGEYVTLTGQLLRLVRSFADDLVHLLGLTQEDIKVWGNRPPEMLEAEARALILDHFGGFPQPETIPPQEHLHKVAVTIQPRNSKSISEILKAAIRWFSEEYRTLPREAVLEFALGHLHGDGAILRGTQDRGLVYLCSSGSDADESTLILRMLEFALGWEPRNFYGTKETLRRPLLANEQFDLLACGAFAFSLARARLLDATEDYLARSADPVADMLLEELSELRVRGNELGLPADFITGVKCLPYPLDWAVRREGIRGEVLPGDQTWAAERRTRKLKPHSGKIELPASGPKSLDAIVSKWRERGFPYPELSETRLLDTLIMLSQPQSLEGDFLPKSTSGVGVILPFHPELWAVRCNGLRSPLDVWVDDDAFREAIQRHLENGGGVVGNEIRNAMALAPGAQRAYIFRPYAAKAVYDYFRPGRVLDFCAGWGSRFLAAVSNGTAYVGIDPAEQIMAGNRKLLETIRSCGYSVPSVDLVVDCAEDVLGMGRFGIFDLIFTSPPYHDTEHYADAPSQSFRRYPDLKDWYSGFLDRCIFGSYVDLSPGGHLVLNVAGWMEERTLEAARAVGFVHVSRWRYAQARPQYRKHLGVYKSEPVLVFRKPA